MRTVKILMLLRALQRTRISCSCVCLMRPPKRWWLLSAITLARLSTHPQHLERLMIGPMAFLNLVKATKTILKRNNILRTLAVMQAAWLLALPLLWKQVLLQQIILSPLHPSLVIVVAVRRWLVNTNRSQRIISSTHHVNMALVNNINICQK